MNAQMLGFFSGFPTHHFPDAVVDRLKEELSVRKRDFLKDKFPFIEKNKQKAPHC